MKRLMITRGPGLEVVWLYEVISSIELNSLKDSPQAYALYDVVDRVNDKSFCGIPRY